MYSSEDVYLLSILQKSLYGRTIKRFCFGVKIDGFASLYKESDNMWYVSYNDSIYYFTDFVDAAHHLMLIVCPDQLHAYERAVADFDYFLNAYNKEKKNQTLKL